MFLRLFGVQFVALFSSFGSAGCLPERLSSEPLAQLGVSNRLALAEQLYKGVLSHRKNYIHKKGPRVTDVQIVSGSAGSPPYTLWDFFVVTPEFCAYTVQRIGSFGRGGKWVCGVDRIAAKKGCIIYSLGVNEESSFEADLLDRTNCIAYGYNPNATEWGREIADDPTLSPRARLFSFGASGKDEPGASSPMNTLSSLMRMNGHTFIDILKVDIADSEFDVLYTVIAEYNRIGRPLPFGQLLVKVHASSRTFEHMLNWWSALESAGLRPFWTEADWMHPHFPRVAEYSFINTRGDHDLIRDNH